MRSGFLSEVKYQPNCFDVFNSCLSVDEEQLIRKGLLDYVCSEYYENAPDTVYVTIDSAEHYLFHVDGFVGLQLFKEFIGNMMLFELKKKAIRFKKKKYYYYNILYLKYDDIRFDSTNKPESQIQKRKCQFSVS